MKFQEAVYQQIQKATGGAPLTANQAWLMKTIESSPLGSVNPSVCMLEQRLRDCCGIGPVCDVDWCDDSTIAATAYTHQGQALPKAVNWQQIIALIEQLLVILGPIFGS